MFYKSTRGSGEVKSAAAIKQGLCGDGGLFMPEAIPELTDSELAKIASMPYYERAAKILSMFLDDYSYDELLTDCREAYSEKRFPGGAAPIHTLKDENGISECGKIDILELWHGPTSAFKDMALQIMPRLLSRALIKTGEDKNALILVATSGDTGKAALEGYKDVDRVKITVFYPRDGVSRIQKLQMATQEGENVRVQAIKGNFDDAQNGVKKIFADKSTAKKLADKGWFLSSANSINWGRLAPQIVYYISAYCDMVNRGDINNGDEINVCVPTGNFGNIFAAYIAKRMGLPIKRLVCASNQNNILTDFFSTGVYDRNRGFYTTMSPSMDILISSNLERLLYLVAGSKKTSEYMKSLSQTGRYEVDSDIKAELDKNFSGAFSSEEQTAETIRSTFDRFGYLVDTHTAVALGCAERYIKEQGDKTAMLVVSTASPYKFARDVMKSLRGNMALKTDETENPFAALKELNEYTGTEIPLPLSSLETKTVRFNPEKFVEPDVESMAETVLESIE